MLFTDDFTESTPDLLCMYSPYTINLIHAFAISFVDPTKERTEAQFMQDLEQFYRLTRIRYTKGGHKKNNDDKIRKSFICQCHGRGSSYLRSQNYRKRDHFFSQSQCKSRVSVRQLEPGQDKWVIDSAELQHNHAPQSQDFFDS